MVNTLPLFQTPPIVDAWHNVTSPGGYEWWYFDAEDVENDRQIVASLFHGCPFHPEYLRRYHRYARNPTRVPPPRPSSCICASFALYHAGKVVQQFLTQYPAEQFEPRHEKRHVQIGANRLTAGNALQELKLTMVGMPRDLDGSAHLTKETALTAYLTFSPQFNHAPNERQMLPRDVASAEHRWIIANAVCDVEGDIILPRLEKFQFRGRGYHDHRYGTAPIGQGILSWFRGRLLLDDRCLTFQFAQLRDRRLEPLVQLIEFDSTGSRDVEVQRAEVDWSLKSSSWLRYPASLHFGESLLLQNPRVIDSSLYNHRIRYDANLRGTSGHALCELVYPERLRTPIIGRTIERGIGKRALV